MINSVFRTGKNYYPQIFLEECKCVAEEKEMQKTTEYITDDVGPSSNDYDREEEESFWGGNYISIEEYRGNCYLKHAK